MRATECQGLITATVTPNTAVDGMLADLGSAFGALGAACRTLLHTPSYPNPHLMLGLVMQLRDEGMPAFILACNAKDRLVVGEERGREVTVHEAWRIPLIAFMVDHPATHLAHLLRAPENCLVSVIDEGHLAFLERAGLLHGLLLREVPVGHQPDAGQGGAGNTYAAPEPGCQETLKSWDCQIRKEDRYGHKERTHTTHFCHGRRCIVAG